MAELARVRLGSPSRESLLVPSDRDQDRLNDMDNSSIHLSDICYCSIEHAAF